MGKVLSKLCSVLYHLTGHLTPDSYKFIHIGSKQIHIKVGLKYRRFLVKHMIRECGKEVNIERHAHFNKDIHLGDY